MGKCSVLLFTRNKETTAKSMTDFFSLQKLQCMHKLGRLARLQQSNMVSDREKALCPHLSKGGGGGKYFSDSDYIKSIEMTTAM